MLACALTDACMRLPYFDSVIVTSRDEYHLFIAIRPVNSHFVFKLRLPKVTVSSLLIYYYYFLNFNNTGGYWRESHIDDPRNPRCASLRMW